MNQMHPSTTDVRLIFDTLASETMLTPAETASVARVKTETLKKWRMSGRGPSFKKIGRSVRYPAGAVRQWLTTC